MAKQHQFSSTRNAHNFSASSFIIFSRFVIVGLPLIEVEKRTGTRMIFIITFPCWIISTFKHPYYVSVSNRASLMRLKSGFYLMFCLHFESCHSIFFSLLLVFSLHSITLIRFQIQFILLVNTHNTPNASKWEEKKNNTNEHK